MFCPKCGACYGFYDKHSCEAHVIQLELPKKEDGEAVIAEPEKEGYQEKIGKIRARRKQFEGEK